MPTITDAICTSFKDEVLGGTHDLDASGDTLKIALIKEATRQLLSLILGELKQPMIRHSPYSFLLLMPETLS